MNEHLLTSFALVLILGIGAQWVAWRIKLPSILLLLVTGMLAGPITGVLNTDELLGDLLFPLVSLSVAVILFEGGLSLRWDDIRETRRAVRNLITIGALCTWLMSSAAAYFVLNLDTVLSLLLGATLVVTGPTVVIPLLHQIRPAQRVGSVLRWEGIIIDPVGAVLAVLIFEEILAGDTHPGLSHAIINLIETLLIGTSIGLLAGRTLVTMFGHYWIPDRLQSPVTLMTVIGVYAVSDVLQAESGLLTVTVMGMVMVNQNWVDLDHIIEFKETLQVVLISSLFILLAARIEPGELRALGSQSLVFVALLILIVRPLAVWISTLRSPLTWQEKAFIAWMAPRGIVAASVASIFTLELAEHGHAGAATLVPVTFAVIIGTVTVYGLTAGVLARYLGLIQENPQGLLLVGAHGWARKIALEIRSAGFRVLLVDTNRSNVKRAVAEGLEAVHADAISAAEDESVIDLSGIGRVLAMTPNDAVNALSNLHFKDTFQELYQLPRRNDLNSSVPENIGGNYLFGEQVTYDYLTHRFRQGAEIKAIRIADLEEYQAHCSDCVVPLFVITEEGQLLVWAISNPPDLTKGHTLIGMIDPTDTVVRETQEIITPESLQPVVKANIRFTDDD